MRTMRWFLSVLMVSFLLVGFGLPKSIDKKVRKELEKDFPGKCILSCSLSKFPMNS